jgi:hypothetical protein
MGIKDSFQFKQEWCSNIRDASQSRSNSVQLQGYVVATYNDLDGVRNCGNKSAEIARITLQNQLLVIWDVFHLKRWFFGRD